MSALARSSWSLVSEQWWFAGVEDLVWRSQDTQGF